MPVSASLFATPSDAQPPVAAAHAAQPWQVLIVCPRGEHLDTARRLIGHGAAQRTVHWSADPERAVQLAQQWSPALAIVDARIDRATAGELLQRLSRSCSGMSVMSFDDRSAPAQHPTPSTWYWTEMPRALDWWLGRCSSAKPTSVR